MIPPVFILFQIAYLLPSVSLVFSFLSLFAAGTLLPYLRTDEGSKWQRASDEEVLLANQGTSADMTALDHIHEPAVGVEFLLWFPCDFIKEAQISAAVGTKKPIRARS